MRRRKAGAGSMATTSCPSSFKASRSPTGSKLPQTRRPRIPKPPPPEPSGHHQNSAIAPVVFGAGQPLGVHLTGDQTPLAVTSIAVGVVRRLSVDADRAGLFLPFKDSVIRDVAPQQIAPIAEPHRPFGEATAGCKPFDGGIALQPAEFLAPAVVRHLADTN